MIHVRFECPKCGLEQRIDDLANAEKAACSCGWSEPIAHEALDGDRMARCPLCGTEDMYVQKDFPERIGLLLVVSGLALATYAWYHYSWIGTFGTLFGFFAVDWILFHTRKDVTVCYRCNAQFRDMAENPAHRAFDLGIGEHYRQERIRKEALKASAVD